jgi:hypothetical protein
METILGNIKERLLGVSYTPCMVSVPASLDIQAGDILSVTDKNGKVLTVYAMTVKTEGRKMTVECTGSHRRDSAEVVNNPTDRQMALGLAQNAAGEAAKLAVESQTQQDVFNRLTDNGRLKGIYMEDGELYINATYLKSGIIDAAVVQVVNLIAEKLKSVSDSSQLEIDGGELRYLMDENVTIRLSSSAMPILYLTDYESGAATSAAELSAHHMKLGGTSVSPVFEISTIGGAPKLKMGSDGYKVLSWKANGDGTFTLIGQ